MVVELRARFDEADNISLAEALQDVGAHVVYGVVGYKTHAKMMLIVRREDSGLKHYAHLGTGNYHPRTARAYTDYGLMTADPAICRDVHNVFLQLTSLGKVPELKCLLQAPFILAGRGMPLHEAIAKVTANPAAAIGMADRGRLAPGLRADLLRVRLVGDQPVIRGIWVAGRAYL